MPTLNQLVRRRRGLKKKKSHSLALEKRAQRKAVIEWSGIQKPKKPNSANRKVCKARLSNGKLLRCYIGGEGHRLQEHSVVLVRGGGVPDLPGVRYHVIRGPRDASPPHAVEPHASVAGDGLKKQARSKYGQKRKES